MDKTTWTTCQLWTSKYKCSTRTLIKTKTSGNKTKWIETSNQWILIQMISTTITKFKDFLSKISKSKTISKCKERLTAQTKTMIKVMMILDHGETIHSEKQPISRQETIKRKWV